MYAEVIVNMAQLNSAFDYAIPSEMEGAASIGSLVEVPFGKQTLQGVIIHLRSETTVENVKAIHAILDTQPVLSQQQIALARWISDSTLTSLSACLELMLPPGLSQHADTLYQLVPGLQINSEELSGLQKRIISKLEERGPLRGRQLQHSFKHVNWKASMQSLQRRGWITHQAVLPPPKARQKTTQVARSLAPIHADIQLSKNVAVHTRRMSVLQFLKQQEQATEIPWIIAQTGAKREDILYLQSSGYLEIVDQETIRDPLHHLSPQAESTITLTEQQDQIISALQSRLATDEFSEPVLLHGITGSGKTEIYLRLTEHVLQQNRQAIILVPEISLTPQTIQRFLNRFGDQVGVIHSRLSPGERYDTWRRIRNAEINVVVGPRSALFAPCPAPALIVIDECHDESFYQREPAPAYDTLTAAIQYGKICQSQVILGSATPTITTLYQAKKENWPLFTLDKRVTTHQVAGMDAAPELPPVEIVDMRQELKAGNRSIFSRSLQESLSKILAKHEQAILFLNRRGAATYVFCRDCGFVLKCPRCNLSLTLHIQSTAGHKNAQLQCHSCHYTRQLPSKCPQCGGNHIRHYGTGTEKVQEMVQSMFPQATSLRWDAETAKGKNAHELLMNRFANHQADILIGTQMLAKGLDIPSVTLVGVILADVGLNFPDYRSSERTFQLLTQVAGRAGRSGLGGKVIFQTFQPDEYAIKCAAKHDYQQFYNQEIQYRQQLGYPPFSRLVRLEYRNRDPQLAAHTAEQMKNNLQGWIDTAGYQETSITGPTPCYFQRINGAYRWQILLMGPDPIRILHEKPLQDWKIEIDPPSIL
ncbi:MAG: primosomal protein N' [Anaerolineaceae bacterium]|nr:primosomal protein N' [Anaerolineaceae bacterium]